ncbi:hypothetical protein ABFS83_03G037000 [Erythranthe nasuta]
MANVLNLIYLQCLLLFFSNINRSSSNRLQYPRRSCQFLCN